jgi:hypothetical protein
LSYSETYWLDCDQDILSYESDCCITTEYGRIRSVAFIRKRYLQQILSDPENPTVWEAGINNGDIIIMAFTAGLFDSGEPVKLKGYGKRLSTHGPRTMNLTFTVPAKKENASFFNDLNFRTDYVPAFRSSTWLHICDTPADITTKELIEDDLESLVVWQIQCVMQSMNLPVKSDFQSVSSQFVCGITVSHAILLESGFKMLMEGSGFVLHE